LRVSEVRQLRRPVDGWLWGAGEKRGEKIWRPNDQSTTIGGCGWGTKILIVPLSISIYGSYGALDLVGVVVVAIGVAVDD